MGEGSKSGNFAFDNFKLDADKLMLYRDGAELPLAPKVVKTLAVLVVEAGTIIGKEELIGRVWSDSIVEESNLTQYLYLLRKTLGSMDDGRPYIETLRRRGYRFNGAVERLTDGPKAPEVPIRTRPEPTSSYASVERDGNVLRVVEWQPAEVPTEPEEASSEPISASSPAASAPTRKQPAVLRLALAVVVLLLVVVCGAFLWPRLMPPATNAESQKELSVVRLTNGAMPSGATISEDGNLFVYHEAEGDIIRMFAQQVGQASRLELLSTSEKVLHSKTFSPDGKFIFYVGSPKDGGSASLYRIPALGGPPVKILSQIDGPVSFSPDGREMVFPRVSEGKRETSLVIAAPDGGGERILLHRQTPKWLGSPSWSPNGKLIAFGEMDIGTGRTVGRCRLYVVEVATGMVTPVSDEKWDNILRVNWFHDGTGIALIGTRENDGYSTRRDQVFYVTYPAGVSRRVTSDGNRHDPATLGVTKDGAILAISANRSSQLWVMKGDGDSSSAQQITRGVADGRAGLGPLPDGKIGYLARTGDDINILLSNADGSYTKQLATGFPFVQELRADPQGKFFVFSTLKDEKHQLFRINADGSDMKQLTSGAGEVIDSSISPDGRWIVYDAVTFSQKNEIISLMRIPSDGGQPVALATKACSQPVYSPDGSMISCVRRDKHEIAVVSATDGTELERHPRPAFATWNFGIGWTPDGSGLVYIVTEKDASNLWVQPRDGGKPSPMTNFSSGIIFRYAFSPDGSKLYVARGYPVQDALLIRNLR